jgi:hypothetical protein
MQVPLEENEASLDKVGGILLAMDRQVAPSVVRMSGNTPLTESLCVTLRSGVQNAKQGSSQSLGVPGNHWRGFRIADDRRGPSIDRQWTEKFRKRRCPLRANICAMRFPGMADAPLLESRVCQYENWRPGQTGGYAEVGHSRWVDSP